MADGEVKIKITGDASGFNKTLNNVSKNAKSKLESAFSGVGAKAGQAANEMENEFSSSINEIDSYLDDLEASFDELRNDPFSKAAEGAQKVSDSVEEVSDGLEDVEDAAKDAADGVEDVGDSAEDAADSVDDIKDSAKKAADGLDDAADSADGLGEEIGDAEKKASSFSDIFKGAFLGDLASSAIQKLGSTVIDLGKKVFEVGSGFQSSMSNVAAISGATGDELIALTNKAKEMGATTQFSASEAADALSYMAMAGWDTNDMLDGLEGIMNLAAASGEDLATTSDIVTDALTAFGMSASQSGKLADIMAAAASNANTNVSMMGDTFKYVAPVAGALGYSAEDVAAAIGLMANAGIKGSQAGTSLRTILSSLANPTGRAATALNKLGISAQDSSRNMIPLRDLLGNLREKFNGLSDAQKSEYAASIAGQEGMSGLLAIVGASNADFNNLINAIDNSSGAAENMANVMNDNVNGALTKMKSALEGFGISIFDSFSGPLQSALESLSTVFGGATELLSPAIEAIKTAFSGLKETINSAFTPEQQAAISSFFQTLGSAVIAAPFQILSAAIQAVVQVIRTLITIGATIVSFFSTTLPNAIQTAANWFQQLPGKISSAITSALNNVKSWAQNVANTMRNGAQNAINGVITFFQQLPGKISAFLTNAVNSAKKWATDMAARAREAGQNVVNAVQTFFSQLPGKITSLLSGALQSLISWGSEMVSNAQSKMQEVSQGITTRLSSLPGELLSIGRNIIQGLINGITGALGALWSKIEGIASGIKSRISSALKIASPSKWAIEIGRYLVEGLALGISRNTKMAISAAGSMASAVKNQIKKLNDDIAKIEAAAAKRQADKELADYKANLKEKYEELEKAEKSEKDRIQKEITELQEEWNEKQLQAQEDAAKELLQTQTAALEKIASEYESTLDGIFDNIESTADKIGSADLLSETERGGYQLNTFQDEIDAINEYGDAIAGLKERGISEGLLSEVLEMDMEKATAYSKKLLAMSNKQYQDYMDLWQEKEDAAARVAAEIYADDFAKAKQEYLEQMGDLPDDMEEIGVESMDAMNEALKERGGVAVETMQSIADRIVSEADRINAAYKMIGAVKSSMSSVSSALTNRSSENSERNNAQANASASRSAAANAVATSGSGERSVVLNVNGREMARAIIPDIRSVESQSPSIVNVG